MLEAQSVPIREYLKEQLMPTLTQGLIQCCKARPANPEDYLVTSAQLVLPLHSAGPAVQAGTDQMMMMMMCHNNPPSAAGCSRLNI